VLCALPGDNVLIPKEITASLCKIEALCQSYALRGNKHVDCKGDNRFVLQKEVLVNFVDNIIKIKWASLCPAVGLAAVSSLLVTG
jgi:hypothetical protein